MYLHCEVAQLFGVLANAGKKKKKHTVKPGQNCQSESTITVLHLELLAGLVIYIGVPVANSVQRLQFQLLDVLHLSFLLPFAGYLQKHVMRKGT